MKEDIGLWGLFIFAITALICSIVIILNIKTPHTYHPKVGDCVTNEVNDFGQEPRPLCVVAVGRDGFIYNDYSLLNNKFWYQTSNVSGYSSTVKKVACPIPCPGNNHE